MATRKIQIIPQEGTYAGDVLHPETEAGSVLFADGQRLDQKIDSYDNIKCKLLRQKYHIADGEGNFFLTQNAIGDVSDNYARPTSKEKVKEALNIKAIPLAPNIDLNNFTVEGLYYSPSNATVNTMKNTPYATGEGQAFSLEIKRTAGVRQIFKDYGTSTGRCVTYERNFYGTTWSAWVKILDQRDYDALFMLVNSGKGKLETTVIDLGGTVSKAGSIATFDEIDVGMRGLGGGVTEKTYGADRLFHCDDSATTDRLYELNKDTLAYIAYSSVGSLSGVGGINGRVYSTSYLEEVREHNINTKAIIYTGEILPTSSIKACGGIDKRLYAGSPSANRVYEINPDNLSVITYFSGGGDPSGVGGMEKRLYRCDEIDDNIVEINPTSGAAISSVSSPSSYPSGIGGIKNRLYTCDRGNDTLYELNGNTKLPIASHGAPSSNGTGIGGAKVSISLAIDKVVGTTPDPSYIEYNGKVFRQI